MRDLLPPFKLHALKLHVKVKLEKKKPQSVLHRSETCEVTRSGFQFYFEETLPHTLTQPGLCTESTTQRELAVQNQLHHFYFQNVALLFQWSTSSVPAIQKAIPKKAFSCSYIKM